MARRDNVNRIVLERLKVDNVGVSRVTSRKRLEFADWASARSANVKRYAHKVISFVIGCKIPRGMPTARILWRLRLTSVYLSVRVGLMRPGA